MNKICIGISGAMSASAMPGYIMLIKSYFNNVVINVIQTSSAEYFLAPGAIKHLPNVHLYRSLDELKKQDKSHVSVVEDIDLFIVCPATANMIGKMANGISDCLLSLCFLASHAEKIILPAMNYDMYQSKALQRNLKLLTEDGCHILGPRKGLSVQTGKTGEGALEEPKKLLELIDQIYSKKGNDR